MGWSSDGKEAGSDGKENAKDAGTDTIVTPAFYQEPRFSGRTPFVF